MRRTLNPRGVRKIDLQRARREARKLAYNLFPEDTNGKFAWRRRNDFLHGWEQGAKDAHKAGLARIDEALAKGTLLLPSKCVHEVYNLDGTRNEDSTLKFKGHIAAPGYGQSWDCTECDKTFTVVGDTVYDNEELDAPLEMNLEDIR